MWRSKPEMKEQRPGETWIYGINPVMEALKSGRPLGIIHLLEGRQSAAHGQIEQIIKLATAADIRICTSGAEFFDSRFPKGHQGIAARTFKKKNLNAEELIEHSLHSGELPLFLILDGIEDPRNMGAILRVADAAGVHGVFFQSRRSAGLSPAASKASAGAMEHVRTAEVVNIKHVIEKMKKHDIAVIGAEADAPVSLWEADLSGSAAVIIGSEGEGMRRTVRDACDFCVSLPMFGSVNSLNASVAAGILCYEARRQRAKGPARSR